MTPFARWLPVVVLCAMVGGCRCDDAPRACEVPCPSGLQCDSSSGQCIPEPLLDAGIPDAGSPDAGSPDAGSPDAGTPDAGTPDAGTPDAGTPDAGTPDAGAVDAGFCPASSHVCASQCVSNFSLATCGSSCTPCSAPAQATATCDGQRCDFQCLTGYVRSGSSCLVAPPAQSAWSPLAPRARGGGQLVYDAARRVVVLFGGIQFGYDFASDTWEWDGQRWTQRAYGVSPSKRSSVALAYDPVRSKAVLFGGDLPGFPSNETWELDGAGWTLRPTTLAPRGRAAAQMAWDSARNVMVLYGGETVVTGGAILTLGDTWEWNGATWTQRMPATSPPALSSYGLAYDARRSRLVLFGGALSMNSGVAQLSGATWEYDGVTWTERSFAVSPSPRAALSLVYDPLRQAVVLTGGADATGQLRETWEYDGTSWTRATELPPDYRAGHGSAYDVARQRLVVYGGANGSAPFLTDTWERSGTQWTQHPMPASPSARTTHAMVWDAQRRQLVLFGGNTAGAPYFANDTWSWRAGRWTQLAPSAAPPQRTEVSMVYDSARGRVVLFGGLGNIPGTSGRAIGDTWEFDGTTWTQRTPPTSPPARFAHQMAYDSGRQRVVLFGGYSAPPVSELGDTWEYDGTTWTQRTTPVAPAARTWPAMAYDATRGRVVLFGGAGGTLTGPETWEWDGTTWSLRQPPTTPEPGLGATLAFHGRRGRVMLVGIPRGAPTSQGLALWEWTGADWVALGSTTQAPDQRLHFALGYDPSEDRFVLHGGAIGYTYFGDTWRYEAPIP